MNSEQSIHIRPTHSYYIEWSSDMKHPLSLTLMQGDAEILGAEILPNRQFILHPSQYITIYTWTGCSIECTSESPLPQTEIGTDLSMLHQGGHLENTMETYMNIHYSLTMARKKALDKDVLGPRVLIVGEKKDQKKEVWTLLINYATKLNMIPIFVDLDRENEVFCNGFIGAAQIQGGYPKDFMSYRNKQVYFCSRQLSKKPYLTQLRTLAKSTMSKLQKQLQLHKQGVTNDEYPSFCTGLIVNIPSSKTISFSKQLLEQTIQAFSITHCLVFDDKNTLLHLKKEFDQIERFSVSPLESMRPSDAENPSQIDLYFNGPSLPSSSILLHKIDLPLNQISIFQLKISSDQSPYCIKLDLTSMEIVKAVITILHAKNDEADQYVLGQRVLTSPVCCLMRIHSIDNGRMSIYSIQEQFVKVHKNSLWIYGRL